MGTTTLPQERCGRYQLCAEGSAGLLCASPCHRHAQFNIALCGPGQISAATKSEPLLAAIPRNDDGAHLVGCTHCDAFYGRNAIREQNRVLIGHWSEKPTHRRFWIVAQTEMAAQEACRLVPVHGCAPG